MSEKLCSLIVPTRRQREPDGLRKALQSIKDTAYCFAEVEILLRIDDDDTHRLGEIPDLMADFNVRVCQGPRGRGYNDMGVFVNDLVLMATGKWCWLFDDDSWVEGDWQQPLSKIGDGMAGGFAVNTQHYQLGESRYDNGPEGGCVGLMIPTALAKTIPHKNPVDQQWLDVIRHKGWTVRQLPGTVYHHCGRPR